MTEQVVSSNNQKNLPVKNNGIWEKIKGFFTKEIEITMTPSQKKIVDYLSQDIEVTMTPKQEKTIKKMKDFLFQEVTFEKKK